MTRPMTAETAHLISEARWLLEGRTNPIDVAAALKRAPVSLLNLAQIHDLPDLRKAFGPLVKKKVQK